jgi:hypothetical protein
MKASGMPAFAACSGYARREIARVGIDDLCVFVHGVRGQARPCSVRWFSPRTADTHDEDILTARIGGL